MHVHSCSARQYAHMLVVAATRGPIATGVPWFCWWGVRHKRCISVWLPHALFLAFTRYFLFPSTTQVIATTQRCPLLLDFVHCTSHCALTSVWKTSHNGGNIFEHIFLINILSSSSPRDTHNVEHISMVKLIGICTCTCQQEGLFHPPRMFCDVTKSTTPLPDQWQNSQPGVGTTL